MRIKIAAILLRIALAASYLSAVADRFGFWGQPGTGSVAWGNFENFLAYTATLNWFAPPAFIPFLGWTATIAEMVIAIGLLVGFWMAEFAFVSGALLTLFAVVMTVASGFEPALSYAVWTAAASSFLLAELPQIAHRRDVMLDSSGIQERRDVS